MTDKINVSILKSIWRRSVSDSWEICAVRSLSLTPTANSDPRFFTFESDFQLLSSSGGRITDVLAGVGPTDHLIKQSILPVVSWFDGDTLIRCIGTAFAISCTGYLVTAAHVLLDPVERHTAQGRPNEDVLSREDLNIGVLIPTSLAYGRGLRFFPFEKCWYWGKWIDSPLVHERTRFEYLTDIAICKVAEMPDGTAHQPLNLSLNAFSEGETAYALGYARMSDISIELHDGEMHMKNFRHDVFVSVGEVSTIFPNNHLRKDVPTPGPCFDFRAYIPGKMSGGPILGAGGAVVRGLVSRSYSGERHAYGAMLGPITQLPLESADTVQRMMMDGKEGIPKVQGAGL